MSEPLNNLYSINRNTNHGLKFWEGWINSMRWGKIWGVNECLSSRGCYQTLVLDRTICLPCVACLPSYWGKSPCVKQLSCTYCCLIAAVSCTQSSRKHNQGMSQQSANQTPLNNQPIFYKQKLLCTKHKSCFQKEQHAYLVSLDYIPMEYPFAILESNIDSASSNTSVQLLRNFSRPEIWNKMTDGGNIRIHIYYINYLSNIYTIQNYKTKIWQLNASLTSSGLLFKNQIILKHTYRLNNQLLFYKQVFHCCLQSFPLPKLDQSKHQL